MTALPSSKRKANEIEGGGGGEGEEQEEEQEKETRSIDRAYSRKP